MLESSVEKAFLDAVTKNGDLCFKIKILGIAGYPDRIVFFKGGGFMWMELKRPGHEPRKLQLHRMKQLRGYKHAVYWADTSEKAIEYYETEKYVQTRKTS